ncbi:PREDICTED: C-X-C motif chemokine 9 [Dipodomys ordii]|uniref:C-X-C motif chemokine n=1 Tax=Dipodomys ordii TaxID=10020 RepID=A0A1S3FID3_DIPOR|nr:PREDICTED: C-X-C motif chemokine 9 [Dipodomys ordii]
MERGIPLLLGIILLLLFGVQGTPVIRNQHCTCINTKQERINPKSVKDLKKFAASPFCEQTEIIATLENGVQTCLDPESIHVKRLLKNWEKQISQKKSRRKGRNSKNSRKFKGLKNPNTVIKGRLYKGLRYQQVLCVCMFLIVLK